MIYETIFAQRSGLDINIMESPTAMKNFTEIVKYLKDFMNTGKSVTIYGDYDVDGLTSTAMLYLLFRSKGVSVTYEVPNRYTEGYGLHDSFIDSLKTDLLICVDNATNSGTMLKKVMDRGIDVIVIDHHNAQEDIFDGLLLNPKQPGDTSVFKDKCAAFLVRTVCSYIDCTAYTYYFRMLAAIATICDSMPLIADNRRLVIDALENLSLVEEYPIALLGLNSSIGHRIGPILNAAGRIGNAREVVDFLTCVDDKVQATKLAEKLINYNEVRKEKTATALENLKVKETPIVVVHDDTIEIGLLGIVAGRLVDMYKRPAVVISKGVGSARSPESVNIFSILSVYEDLYSAFGGHANACGFHLDEPDIPILVDALSKTECECDTTLKYDLEIDIDDVTIENCDSLEPLKPFGNGNTEPVFLIKNANIYSKKLVGQNANVLQLYFKNNVQGVMFNCNKIPLSNTVDIKCYLRKNEWNGKLYPRIFVLEINEV